MNTLPFTEEERKSIIKEYDSATLSIKEITDKYNISAETLYRWIHKFGSFPNGGKRDKAIPRKYPIDENFFEKIDTEEKAYWLGFLYADGWVGSNTNVIGLRLASIDISHIEKYKKSLKSGHPIKTQIKKAAFCKSSNCMIKETTSSFLCFSSKKTKIDLIKQGCVPRKSLVINYPSESQVPKHLIRHFLRGNFDGDGCITCSTDKFGRINYRMEFIGPLAFVSDIKSFLKSELDINGCIQKQKNIYRFSYGGNHNTRKLGNFLFEKATIYLDRKYKKYLEMIQNGIRIVRGKDHYLATEWKFIDPDGKELLIKNLRLFCKQHPHLNRSMLLKLHKNKIKFYKGYRACPKRDSIENSELQ